MAPIQSLDEWAGSRSQSLPLASLKGAVVGIDASHYISLHLNHYPTKEPLLIALGGFPFALRSNIEKELQNLKNLGITCVFVFNGLEFGKKEHTFSAQAESARALEHAWELYDNQQADQVVDAFSSAGSTKPETLYKFLQRILHDQSVDFLVAPYGAAAQLSYLAKGATPFVDAIFGSSDVFLFDVEKLITRFDAESAHFSWITRQACQDELGRLTKDQFTDFCLLLGSQYLRTFPPFGNPSLSGKSSNIREALSMFNAAGRNVMTLCNQFDEDQRVQNVNYLDLYKRALMTVKHFIITDLDGTVGPMDPDRASSDMHELIGLRLPEELYFYMSKGVLGSRIPNCLTSGEVLVTLPLGAEDSEIYRRLVGEILTPIRTQALGLLSNSLHRFYQTKVITIRTWYDDKSGRSINLKDLPSVKDSIVSWKVKSDQLPEELRKVQSSSSPLIFAVQALKDSDFASKTFAAKDAPILSSKEEITSTVMWRFLQLRGYVNESHQLTAWGQALEKALSTLDPSEKLEEACFVAVELLRLGILGSKNWFTNISGGPMRGSDDDKKFNLMVSRVACVGKLRHKSIGYSGPLSRQLLSYRSLISAVRSSLRDLVEVVLAGLLLSGDADRERKDWAELPLSLPFIDDNDCGLGIAVRTYLDDLPQNPEPTSPSVRAEIKAKGMEWFQHSNSFSGNLDVAFQLWDAVYEATQNVGSEFQEAQLWADANKWLEDRR